MILRRGPRRDVRRAMGGVRERDIEEDVLENVTGVTAYQILESWSLFESVGPGRISVECSGARTTRYKVYTGCAVLVRLDAVFAVEMQIRSK